MRPIVLTLSGAGTSPMAILDRHKDPFSVSLGLIAGAGGGTGVYTVQHTFGDAFGPAASLVWHPHAFLVGVSPNIDGNYAFPVSAVRLVCTTAGSPALGTLVVTQAGI